jgi:hypothetical protein
LIAAYVVIAFFLCAVPATATPCNQSNGFLRAHETIVRLAERTEHANAVSQNLRNTMRSRPYKEVENDWEEVKKRTGTMLDNLTDMLIALDDEPNTAKKEAAANLVIAYQSALRNLVDSTRSAIYLERTENAVSMVAGMGLNLSSGYFNYSIPRAPAQMNVRNISRSTMEAQTTQRGNALRSLKLPERIYGDFCNVAFSGLPYARRLR